MRNPASRSRLRTALLAALLGCAAYPVQAGTLTQAVLAAMNNHPAVEAAQANADAVSQEETQQFSNFMPKVSMRAAGGRVYGDNATSRGLSVTRGAGYSGYGEGSVSLTQTIYDSLSSWDKYRAAEKREESAAFSIDDVREDLALRVALAYLDALRGDDALRLADAHEKLLKDYVARIRDMVKEGAAEESMAIQAEDIVQQLAHTRSDLEQQLDSALADYVETVGARPTAPMPMPQPPAALIPPGADAAFAAARTSHPALKAAVMKQEAFERDGDAGRGRLFPNLTSELSYRTTDQRDLIGGESTDARALLHLNWEYSLGGAEIARMREARQRAVEAKAQRETEERAIESAIRKAYAKLGAAEAQLAVSQDREDLNERLLKNSKAQFEGAKMNILQVLQAENALFNAKLTLLNDRYRVLASRYAVIAGMGRMREALAPAAASPSPAPEQAHADAR